MPSRILFPLLGLLVVGALVGLLFYANRGAHIEIKGEVQKVRTHSAEDQASVVILDFRFVNPADYPFVVRKIDVTLVGKDGKTTDGAVIADSDAARYLTYYPVLGQKYNDSLVIREKVLLGRPDPSLQYFKRKTSFFAHSFYERRIASCLDAPGGSSPANPTTSPNAVQAASASSI